MQEKPGEGNEPDTYTRAVNTMLNRLGYEDRFIFHVDSEGAIVKLM